MRPLVVVGLVISCVAGCDKTSDNEPARRIETATKGDSATAEVPVPEPAQTEKAINVKDALPASGWHETRLKQGYRFETPGIPTRSVDDVSGITTYQIKADDHYYLMQTMKIPEFLAGLLDDESALAAGFAKAEENMLKAMNATTTKKAQRMVITGLPSNEIVASGREAGQEFFVVARQSVDSKENTLYQLMILHPGSPVDAKKREQFFGSFRATSR